MKHVVLLCASLGLASAAMQDGAALKLTLSRAQSTAGSLCAEGDAFRFHDAALTLAADGRSATLGDVTGVWEGGQQHVLTTSGGEAIRIDPQLHTFTMPKAGGLVCVYDMEVKAGGSSMGLQAPAGTALAEAGVWQYGPFDQARSEGTHCASLPTRSQAFIAYTSAVDNATHVVFGAMDGVVSDAASKRTTLTSHFLGGPNAQVFLTVDPSTGVVRFSTLVDIQRNLPVGCVYPIMVVDGSVLGRTPGRRIRRRQ